MNKMNLPVFKQLPNKTKRHKIFGSVEPGPRTKPTNKTDMTDIQNSKQDYLFKKRQVGVSNINYPVIVKSERQPKTQTSIGAFTLGSEADLYELDYISKLNITCENEEFIHLHHAIAVVSYDKEDERP